MRSTAPSLLYFLLTFSFIAAASDDTKTQMFDAHGIQLSYRVEGRGDPVVLIHGLHSSVSLNWKLPGILDMLAKKYQVIALDLPGHGASNRPENKNAYGMAMVEDVNILMDHLKIKKAHIVGYSMGGMVAMKFIATHPTRVLSGTIGGMGWLPDHGILQRVWELIPKQEGSLTPTECVRSFGQLALSEKELKAIAVPVMILIGDLDPCKKLYVAPLQKVREDWPVIEIQYAGHLNCVFKPQFKDEIRKWFDKYEKK